MSTLIFRVEVEENDSVGEKTVPYWKHLLSVRTPGYKQPKVIFEGILDDKFCEEIERQAVERGELGVGL